VIVARFVILIALALAGPSDRAAVTCAAPHTQEQARLLLAEWRKAIRAAETPDEWAAVNAIAQEVSRLAAPSKSLRTRMARSEALDHSPRFCTRTTRS
jgi:hypothetical protein